MKSTSKLTTKGFGFFVQIVAALFIIALMVFTISHLAPVTETRIADCSERIETLESSLASAKKTQASEEDIRYIEGRISMYENRIEMLQNREKYYSIAMLFLVCVLLAGAVMQSVKTASFIKPSNNPYQQITYSYYPFIGAPLSAVCILLAIGVTYRAIFEMSLFDLVTLVGAVFVGALVFLVYRRSPYVTARLSTRRIGNSKFTYADALFFVPAGCIAVLLGMLFLFGVTVNGAKLWISVFGTLVQPGEFIKVLLAVLFASAYGKMWRALVAVGVSGLTVVGMLALRDMGTAIVIFAMAVIMLLLLLDNKMTFSMYEHKKLLILLLVLAIPLFVVVLSFFPYARERFSNVGTAMEQNAQQAEMLKALIFGGTGGLGIENSSYILNIFAIDSDMAIAGVTAIFGYGMLLIVLLCYALLVVVPLRKHAVYREFYFVTAQVSVVLIVQVLFNALGAVDVLPFTGIVAPFLSSGGSALASFCAMAGLVLATLHPVIKPLEVSDL